MSAREAVHQALGGMDEAEKITRNIFCENAIAL